MPVVSLLRSVGNKVYERSFPIYQLVYRFFKAYTDRAERRLLRRILFAGAVAVDAGANIGIYSQFLSRCVGSTGVVHSFEPSFEKFWENVFDGQARENTKHRQQYHHLPGKNINVTLRHWI